MQIQRGKNCPCFPTAHTGGEAGGGEADWEAGYSRNGQLHLGFKGPWSISPGTSSHESGSEPGGTGPCVRTQPSCLLSIGDSNSNLDPIS